MTMTRRVTTVMSKLHFLVLSLILSLISGSFVFDLEFEKKECFLIRVPNRTSSISGNYDCLKDELGEFNSYAISAWLERSGPSHTVLWQSEEGATEDVFSVLLQEADLSQSLKYALCFEYQRTGDNDDDNVGTTIPVGFSVRVRSLPRSLPDGEVGPDAQRALKMTEAATEIETDWENLLDHFEFLRNREAVHMQLNQQILDRVMRWTLLESILVVGMAFGQVMYWRKFFEQRRYL